MKLFSFLLFWEVGGSILSDHILCAFLLARITTANVKKIINNIEDITTILHKMNEKSCLTKTDEKFLWHSG